MLWKHICGVICLLLLFGCAQPEPPHPAPPPPEKKLLIGLKPEGDLFSQLERYDPVMKYLSRKTGLRIETKVFPRYRIIVDRFVAEKLDGAFFGNYTYAMAHEKLGVEPVARPVETDNTSTYHAVILVRKDGGIRNARGMRGKRFAFVSRWTFDGYLFPLEYLYQNGVKNHRKFLKETYFAGTHEDVIRDLLARKADAGGTKNTVYRRMAKEDPRVEKELKIIARSEEVPQSGLALRKGIDPSDRDRLKGALLAMHTDPEGKAVLARFGASRFIETTNKDYKPAFRYLENIRPHLTDESAIDR